MSGKKNNKWLKTMVDKFGDEKAVSEYMQSIASKGGKNGTGHSYGHGKVSPVVNGALGGKKSRKGYKLIDETATTYTYEHKITSKLLKVKKG